MKRRATRSPHPAALALLTALACACGHAGETGVIVRRTQETCLLSHLTTSLSSLTSLLAATAPAQGMCPTFTRGRFTLLTYNVAGLPPGLTSRATAARAPQISPLLNDYDVVLVQEDFWYHRALDRGTRHAFASTPWTRVRNLGNVGDGLNRWSTLAFADHERVTWSACHGRLHCKCDCLANKGFSVARHELGDGLALDIYNIHADAGGCSGDHTARVAELDELAAFIERRSAGEAVIVAGDFNLNPSEERDHRVLHEFAARTGLRDSCAEERCAEGIDRVFLRSGRDVALTVQRWEKPTTFLDPKNGAPLSDHVPVAVTIRWTGRAAAEDVDVDVDEIELESEDEVEADSVENPVEDPVEDPVDEVEDPVEDEPARQDWIEAPSPSRPIPTVGVDRHQAP